MVPTTHVYEWVPLRRSIPTVFRVSILDPLIDLLNSDCAPLNLPKIADDWLKHGTVHALYEDQCRRRETLPVEWEELPPYLISGEVDLSSGSSIRCRCSMHGWSS